MLATQTSDMNGLEGQEAPTAFMFPQPWVFRTRSIAVRLFVTCWMVYAVHVATNTVREIYLALAIGDHFSFRVDDYANMHPDLFEKPGYGWHIGANPGASMLGAVPYFLSRPVIDPIVAAVNRTRAADGRSEPPPYNSPWPMRRAFYAESWRRGYDIKFGLAALVMQWFCMAPISALGVVAMFFLLRRVFGSDRIGLWLALLYAFGTPVFFRTGFLEPQYDPRPFCVHRISWCCGILAGISAGPRASRYFFCGLMGGATVLLDYSGIVMLLGLFCYAVLKAWKSESYRHVARSAAYYVLGSVGPILLLWLYQWRSFGNPFLPGQHWMPPVEWIDIGYQGFTWPQPALLWHLLFDYRYGLFTTCPLLLVALLSLWWLRTTKRFIPVREFAVLIAAPLGSVGVLQRHQLHPPPIQQWHALSGSHAAFPVRACGSGSGEDDSQAIGIRDLDYRSCPGLVHGHVARRGARIRCARSDPSRFHRRFSDPSIDGAIANEQRAIRRLCFLRCIAIANLCGCSCTDIRRVVHRPA